MSVHIQARVAIAAPPEVVFEAVSDWEAQSDWVALTTVTVDRPSAGVPGGRGVGEQLTAVTKLAGVGFRDPMEVTRFQPPHLAEVRHLGRVVRGTGTFTVEPAPGGSWFTWAEDLDLPFGAAGRLGFALVRPAFEVLLRRSLARLVRRVESRGRARGGEGGG